MSMTTGLFFWSKRAVIKKPAYAGFFVAHGTFIDYLIACIGESTGGGTAVTFDRMAAQHTGMQPQTRLCCLFGGLFPGMFAK